MEGGVVASQSWDWSHAVLDVLDEALAIFRIARGADGHVREVVLQEHNRAATRILSGRTEDRAVDLYGRELGDLGLDSLHKHLRSVVIAVADGRAVLRRRITVDRNGSHWCEITGHPVDEYLVSVLIRDVSELVRQEKLLESAYDNAAGVRATLQTALDSTSDCFAVYDVQYDSDLTPSELRLVMINAAGAEPFGVPDDLIGMDLREFYPVAKETGLWGAICGAVVSQMPATFRLQEYDGDGAWKSSWDNTIAPVSTDQVVVTWRNVTVEERRQRQLAVAHDQAQHAALHDDLTGLANRALLEEKLEQVLETTGAGERLAVAFCDLDGFKEINDTLGHQVGDEVLRAVSRRLSTAVRSSDIVARVGGDEFVLLLRNLPPEWDVHGFSTRIRAIVEERLPIPGLSGGPRLSIGVSVAPPEPREQDVLMRLADERMYEDKMRRRAHRSGAPVPEHAGEQALLSDR
jgi:diguanylate cyclase (GGDEF)-like protein